MRAGEIRTLRPSRRVLGLARNRPTNTTRAAANCSLGVNPAQLVADPSIVVAGAGRVAVEVVVIPPQPASAGQRNADMSSLRPVIINLRSPVADVTDELDNRQHPVYMAPRPEPVRPPGWLPKAEFDSIFSRVPRLCVEVVIVAPERGVLLTRRDIPPNVGAWHIPGGTVLFGEPLVQSVKRVARDELGLEVAVGEMLGYIEYPSHYNNGLDSPVGIAFATEVVPGYPEAEELREGCEWFSSLPEGLYEEQRDFLMQRVGLEPSGHASTDR